MSIDYSKLSDDELCKLIESKGAFKELEFRYLWLIRLKASELVKNNFFDNFDKDDFIQEGLLGLYYCAKFYDASKNTMFKTYAGVCIKNCMLNELKRKLRQNNSENLVSLEEIEFSVSSPEEHVELREDFKAVLNQIHISLSDFEKKILALYLSGYKRSEIPNMFGVSLKAYDNALARCRKKLKEQNCI